MTNTTQTDLLDGVEPDLQGEAGFYYLEAKVETLLEAQRAEYEARIDASRKQVLLMAMRAIKYEMGQGPSYEILRRMALEPTGDKGDGNE